MMNINPKQIIEHEKKCKEEISIKGLMRLGRSRRDKNVKRSFI